MGDAGTAGLTPLERRRLAKEREKAAASAPPPAAAPPVAARSKPAPAPAPAPAKLLDDMGFSETPKGGVKSGFFPKPASKKTFEQVFEKPKSEGGPAVNKGFLFAKKDKKPEQKKKETKKKKKKGEQKVTEVDFFAGAEDEFECAIMPSSNDVELGLFTTRKLAPGDVFLTESACPPSSLTVGSPLARYWLQARCFHLEKRTWRSSILITNSWMH